MQSLLVFQSLWAMELRSSRRPERSVEESVRRIAEAGFDGVSAHWHDRAYARRLHALLGQHGLQAEGQCFPKTVDDLKPVLENAAEFGVHHICLQPDVRLRRIEDCIPLLEGWKRRALVDLARHYGSHPRACQPYRAKTKGKVERPFRYIREDFFLARTFRNLDDLNECPTPTLA